MMFLFSHFFYQTYIRSKRSQRLRQAAATKSADGKETDEDHRAANGHAASGDGEMLTYRSKSNGVPAENNNSLANGVRSRKK
jgi:hypothetical protein